MIFLLYGLAIVALAVGTAAIYMALLQAVPVAWQYYHYLFRKPIVWSIFVGSVIWAGWETWQTGRFSLWTSIPLILMALAVVLAHKMHQESVFKAIDYPTMTEDATSLPLHDDMQLAVIEYGGVTKAYPLDYVAHHHIINDRFGDHIVSLTYCPMCRSIIPFDVTDIGPLSVGSFKKGNMIVADRKTKTFFQQATFESIVGPLHPHTLNMVYFQILSWSDVKQLSPLPAIAQVTEYNLRAFELPIPGIWQKLIASEITPGLSAKDRDKTLPARTRVVGIVEPAFTSVVYLKEELLEHGVVKNDALNIMLIALNDTVNGFKSTLDGRELNIMLNADKTLTDIPTETVWDMRGHYLEGEIQSNLEPIAISDEYWFSWKTFHPQSTLIRGISTSGTDDTITAVAHHAQA